PSFGVIEGFYGQQWPDMTRKRMFEWLARGAFTQFMYAPKAASFLRKEWRRPLQAADSKRLQIMHETAATAGLCLHLGLSPFEAYSNYDSPTRESLKQKLLQLEATGCAALAILFDDMSGRAESLARRQLEIVWDVCRWFPKWQLAVCPTYYSDDPVLDRLFGVRPEDYLEELAQALPEHVSVFWTGPQVCSSHIDADDLQSVAAFGTRLALWDNYPVNDSQARSEHLYLKPLARDGSELASKIGSHWCNAMNQGALSLPALLSLPECYTPEPRSASELPRILEEAGLTPRLLSKLIPLDEISLSELEPTYRIQLEELSANGGMAATELRDWLAGKYAFDPNCLTD
ncbi:MAG: beta-N-acetylglucosaminidase domain-containing protein, partial [Pseudomonadota bacterium]